MTVTKAMMECFIFAFVGKGAKRIGGGGGSNNVLTNWDGTKKRNGWGM